MTWLLSPLTAPLGAIWLLMVVGVAWLVRRGRWRAALSVACPAALLALVGSTPLAYDVVAAAERPLADTSIARVAPADVVIALGGGYYVSDHDQGGFAFSGAGSRVITALELARRGKARQIVLGGSVPIRGRPGLLATGLVQHWAAECGLAPVPVTNLGFCANTHDEAIRSKALCAERGWTNILLVTSALHLPRAVAVLNAQGLAVRSFACDFQAFGVPNDHRWSLVPRQEPFDVLALYLHEKIGWWVYRARGWIQTGSRWK